MYKLRTLGRIELVRGSGTPIRSVLSQPKRLALLAYLATASDELCGRDRLVEVFWPELDPENARHALSQALYYLRRSLGKDTVVSEGPDRVRISPDHLWCDARAFREALGADRFAEALNLYQGNFLEGFALPDEPEVRRWADELGSQLRSEARDAAILLSERAQEDSDLDRACAWAERAVELAALEERPLRRLLECLHTAGDRARAVAAYEVFRQRLKQGLGVEPSAQTVRLVEAISKVAEPQAPPEPQGQPSETSEEADQEPEPEVEPVFSGKEGSKGIRPHRTSPSVTGGIASNQPTPRLPPGRLRRLATLGTGPASLSGWAVALVLGMIIAFLGRGEDAIVQEEGPVTEGTRIAVLPFTFQGSEQHRYLGDGISELLNIGLGEIYPLRMVNPHALSAALLSDDVGDATVEEATRVVRRFGAEFYVAGTVIEIGERLEILVYLHDSDGVLLATLREHSEVEAEVFRAVDDLVRGLVALEHLPEASPLVRTAAVTTHSFPALRSFLKGEQLYRRGEYAGAIQAMERAVALDSSFALAYYRGALSTLWLGSLGFDLAREWISGALTHVDRLPEQEQRLIRAMDAFLRGVPLEAEQRYRQILADQPENAEAWFNLGELLFHYGPIMGRDPFESREAWERVLEVEPNHSAALFHLAVTAVAQDRPRDLQEILDRFAEVEALGPPSLSLEAVAAWMVGDASDRARVLSRVRHEPGRAPHWAVEYLVRYLGHVPAAQQVATVVAETAQTPEEQAEAHLRLALLELTRGRVSAAETRLDAMAALNPTLAEMFRIYLSTLPQALVELRALAPRQGEDPPGVQAVRDATPTVRPSARSPAERLSDILSGPNPTAPALADVGWYLVGLHAAHATGAALDQDQVLEAIEQLRALHEADADRWPMAQALAGGLQAELDMQAQRRAEAAERLGSATADARMWYERNRVSSLYSMVRERFMLAERLQGEGARDEAGALFGSLVRTSLGEAPMLGPTWIRMAELQESQGDVTAAVALYQKVVELWEDSDPELQDVVAELRARIRGLDPAVAWADPAATLPTGASAPDTERDAFREFLP